MTWHAQLDLAYSQEHGRTVARHQHHGPLRILQSLYPEGDSVCHNVLVHPPGGLVGGDTINMRVHANPNSHGLITTPGATRFYRSDGLEARQRVEISVAAKARVEWLPMETLAYSGCRADNHLEMQVEMGGELLAWDITALGLPLAQQPFCDGYIKQHLAIPGVWQENGVIAANDAKLLLGPAGLDGHHCLGTLLLVAGSPFSRDRRDEALSLARQALAGHLLAPTSGATSPHPQVIVVRVLAPVVEPAMEVLRQIRHVWRRHLWGLVAENPRIWSM